MNALLNTKIDALEAYLQDLRDIEPANFDVFEQDKMLRRYAERMLHMTIDACIQIGIQVLTEEGLRAPENYHDVFTVLGDHRILSAPLVNSMTMMVELRNVLVYEYDVVDHMMIYSVLKRRLDDLAEFIRALRAYANGEPYIPSPLFEPSFEE
ncbi:MAG: DUF86 domain-containing protein [Chloroflexota bacterium]|nr:MAG: DUF86 domain-containing protein [Chloroflexota bacterium]